MLPRRLKNFNIFLDGYSMLGIAEEVVLPKLVRKMEEYRAAGMNGPLKADFGHEAMELEVTSAEIDANLIKLWGTSDLQGVGLRFRAAMEREGSDASVEGLEIVVRGRFSEIDPGTAKAGEKHSAKYKLEISYLKITDNGNDLVEIDVLNMVEVVDGRDILAEQREALGI